MRYSSDDHRRYDFRDWLRGELQRMDFYIPRTRRFMTSEFVRYARQHGAHVEEVSMGRYLREEEPVLPTPASCRELARALGRHPVEVLLAAGYLEIGDFIAALEPATTPLPALSEQDLAEAKTEIDHYSYAPKPIREQMKEALEREVTQKMQLR